LTSHANQGVMLLAIPPAEGAKGTKATLCLSQMYAVGLLGYTISYYAFGTQDSDSWVSSAYQRVFYTNYAIGAAAGLVSLLPSAFTRMRTPAASWYAGIGCGVVFGIQVNTIGAWLLQPSSLPVYLTLASCMAVGALLLSLALVIWHSAGNRGPV